MIGQVSSSQVMENANAIKSASASYAYVHDRVAPITEEVSKTTNLTAGVVGAAKAVAQKSCIC
ncbi:hypothetical protein FOMPIDRAFT_121606 [Fomitopsis schrenkii]|uniref:Uncharacterized protein n=1 Tax=Fomitopsis schrenkii TaxID=2126942 RepID=S8EFL5_FOMSC|nr:hypothetical protein FOMPIDRAFT_121606 [Fomitopsis schrenkii]